VAIDIPCDDTVRFTADDDGLHPPGPQADWTETTWWSFHVAERALAGWLYVQVRPNLGTVAGGAFVYDAGAWLPWELPYFAWQYHQPLPEACDLRDVAFRTGVSVRALEPGLRYQLGYRFRDHTAFLAELAFEGLTPPVPHLPGAPPFTGSSHYDQHGRVTGTITLHGETIPVDCLSVRDRSWGRRPELLGRRRLSYCFGATSPTHAFLVFAQPDGAEGDDQAGDVERVTSGYLWRDGIVSRLRRGERRNRRDAATGGVAQIDLDAVDDHGRALRARAEARSRMALPTHSLTVNTFLEWALDGGERGFGEDQEVWPMAHFAAARRAAW
jgi:hypothetical protein